MADWRKSFRGIAKREYGLSSAEVEEMIDFYEDAMLDEFRSDPEDAVDLFLNTLAEHVPDLLKNRVMEVYDIFNQEAEDEWPVEED